MVKIIPHGIYLHTKGLVLEKFKDNVIYFVHFLHQAPHTILTAVICDKLVSQDSLFYIFTELRSLLIMQWHSNYPRELYGLLKTYAKTISIIS